MLVLGRKLNEGIQVDGPAEIIVLRVQGKQVSLGIRAGKDVRILRTELEAWEPNESPKAATGTGGL